MVPFIRKPVRETHRGEASAKNAFHESQVLGVLVGAEQQLARVQLGYHTTYHTVTTHACNKVNMRIISVQTSAVHNPTTSHPSSKRPQLRSTLKTADQNSKHTTVHRRRKNIRQYEEALCAPQYAEHQAFALYVLHSLGQDIFIHFEISAVSLQTLAATDTPKRTFPKDILHIRDDKTSFHSLSRDIRGVVSGKGCGSLLPPSANSTKARTSTST